MIDNNGIEFFKLFTPILKITSVKSYPVSVGHYWYSSIEGIIVLSLSPPKLGQFWSFFVNQNKGSKMFNGPKFSLDLTPCVTDKWILSSTNISSLTYFDANFKESPHAFNLVSLYGRTYVFHIQCLTGLLTILDVSYEKVQENRKIKLPIGQYGIRSVDNLVLMQNYYNQETYVIDIKSQKYFDKPFCLIWNNMKESLPSVSIKLKVFIEKPKVVTRATFLYDNKPIGSLSEFSGVETLGGEGIESPMSLNSSLMYVDADICVDPKAGRCYKLQFSPGDVVKYHPDRIETVLFLFRRTGYKLQAYDFLKDCLRKYIHIKELSYFFSIINQNYKDAIIDKKNALGRHLSLPGPRPENYSRKNSLNLEPEIKPSEGMVVLFQSDVFSVLFQSLFEENTVKLPYLACVLQEYIHSLVDLDIEVQNSLQLLLARILVKSGNLITLENLLHFGVLTDSYEIINLLIQIVPIYANALQIGVDMLFRMRYFEKLIDVMLYKNFVYESLSLLAKVSYPRFDIRKLLSKCEEIGDEQLTLVVTQFIKEKSL